MNFNHKLFFCNKTDPYTLDEWKQLSYSKYWYGKSYIEYVLWIGLRSYKKYSFYTNDKIQNLNNNSYKFTDLKFNTHTVVFDTIFSNILKL